MNLTIEESRTIDRSDFREEISFLDVKDGHLTVKELTCDVLTVWPGASVSVEDKLSVPKITVYHQSSFVIKGAVDCTSFEALGNSRLLIEGKLKGAVAAEPPVLVLTAGGEIIGSYTKGEKTYTGKITVKENGSVCEAPLTPEKKEAPTIPSPKPQDKTRATNTPITVPERNTVRINANNATVTASGGRIIINGKEIRSFDNTDQVFVQTHQSVTQASIRIKAGETRRISGSIPSGTTLDMDAAASVVIEGELNGIIKAKSAANITVMGNVNGVLRTESACSVHIGRSLNGSCQTGSGSSVHIGQSLNGSLTVESGSAVTVGEHLRGRLKTESGCAIALKGKLDGALTHGSGCVINRNGKTTIT